MRSCVMIIAGLLLSLPVAAAPPRPRPAASAEKAKEPRVQRLSFDDDIVAGRRDLGGGDLLVERPRRRLPSLVKPRPDFLPELYKSADAF